MDELFLPATILLYGGFLVLSKFVDRRSSVVRSTILVCYAGVFCRYLIWRMLMSFDTVGPRLEAFFVGIFAALECTVGFLTLRGLRGLRHSRSRSDEADKNAHWYGEKPPLVDVLVPTYNEGYDILFRTLAGITGMDYLRYRVWVLDDGRRAWVADLAARFGVEYISREANTGYKAGNINNGLRTISQRSETPADYIAVFDADFVPKPRFLTRTMALMQDPRVAMAQTPQYFFNSDPVQTVFGAKDAWPDDQRGYFHSRLPSANEQSLVLCCGTSFVMRRDALESVGGFATDVVVEDTLTSLRLLRTGWKTVYLEEHLSTGLAPEGLAEFLTQRGKWCLGSVQIAFSDDGALARKPFVSGLIGTLESFRWPLHAFVRCAWLALPILYFYFDFVLLPSTSDDFYSYIIPVFLARASMIWLTSGTYLPIFNEVADLLMTFAIVPAAIQGIRNPRRQAFRVTDKGRVRTGYKIYWNVLIPLAVLALSLAVGCVGGLSGWLGPTGGFGGRGWVYAFTFYKIVVVCAALLVAIEPLQARRLPRFSCDWLATIHRDVLSVSARLCSISEGGACAIVNTERRIGADAHVEIDIPGIGRVEARMVGRRGKGRIGLEFQEMSHDVRVALIRRIYAGDDVIRQPSEWSFWSGFRPLLRTFFWPRASQSNES